MEYIYKVEIIKVSKIDDLAGEINSFLKIRNKAEVINVSIATCDFESEFKFWACISYKYIKQ